MPRRTPRALVAALLAGGLLLAGCSGGGSSDSTDRPSTDRPAAADSAGAAASGPATGAPSTGGAPVSGTLSLYGYSVAKTAYDGVIPGFTAGQGAGVQFQQSYGASGDQSRKVAAGAPADIVSLSIEPDVTRLVDAGIVAKDWNAGPNKGIPFGSVVTIVVRTGNPLGIKDWPDLLKPGVNVVTPNPFSSGSAKWNLLAPYVVQSAGGSNQFAGLGYLDSLISGHIHVQPGSGREATEMFLQGTGDVLLSYEDEALAMERAGNPVQHVTPPQTLKIENPVAVSTKSANPVAAQAFVDYLYTPDAQRRFAKAGFRPVDQQIAAEFAADFPAPDKLWTVSELGDWASVDTDLFAKGTGKIAVLYDKATR